MKKFFGILILAMLWCNISFSNSLGKCVQGNCGNGKGTKEYLTGNAGIQNYRYVGEFKDARFEGEGTYTSFSKDLKKEFIYVGEFKDARFEGEGTYTSFSKDLKKEFIYVGEFKDNRFEGKGKLTVFFRNLKVHYTYVGEFKKSRFHGYGKADYNGGNVMIGQWRYGEFIGDEKKLDQAKKKKEEVESVAQAKKKKDEQERIAQAKKKKEEDARTAQAKKKKEEQEKAKLYIIGSGTGFFVSSEGHVVSNDHVVGICRSVAAKIDGKIINFNVISTDKVNDLGLIKGDYKSKKFLSIKTDGAEFGEDIVAFGYPLSDDLSDSVKLTRGIVSSLSGPGNNYSEIQIDAAIQKGNSGGPVMNMDGQVVGVASSGLSKLYILEKNEFIPENINFAVAAPTLSNFLKANGVSIRNTSMKISNTKELAKIGRPATLQLFCMNTKAAYQKLKNKKKHSDVLLEKVVELR